MGINPECLTELSELSVTMGRPQNRAAKGDDGAEGIRKVHYLIRMKSFVFLNLPKVRVSLCGHFEGQG